MGTGEVVEIPQARLLDYLSTQRELSIEIIKAIQRVERAIRVPPFPDDQTLQNALITGQYQPYQIKQVFLDAARTDELWVAEGDSISWATDGSLTGLSIRTNHPTASSIPLDFYKDWHQRFFRVFLTNNAQAGKTLYLSIGRGGAVSTIAQKVYTDIIAQTIGNLTVDIVAQTLGNLAIDLKANSIGNLPIDLKANSIGNLPIDIKAQTIGNLAVNIAAQVANIAIAIVAQNVAITTARDWAAQSNNNKSFTGSAIVDEGTTQPVLSYPVPAGKVYYIDNISSSCSTLVGGVGVEQALTLSIGGSDVWVLVDIGKVVPADFSTPFKATAGQLVVLKVTNFGVAPYVFGANLIGREYNV